MPPFRTLDVGLDVHKEAIAVAYVATAHDAELIYLGTIGALQAAKFRLQAILLRQDIHHMGWATRGPTHLRWRSEIVPRR